MVVHPLNVDGYKITLQDFLHLFGPLDEAIIAAVEIFFKADAGSVGGLVNAIEIKMIEWRTAFGPVFINNSEGWRRGNVLHTEFAADFLNQGRFARAHLPIKTKYTLAGIGFQDGFRHFGELLFIGGYLLHIVRFEECKYTFYCVISKGIGAWIIFPIRQCSRVAASLTVFSK